MAENAIVQGLSLVRRAFHPARLRRLPEALLLRDASDGVLVRAALLGASALLRLVR